MRYTEVVSDSFHVNHVPGVLHNFVKLPFLPFVYGDEGLVPIVLVGFPADVDGDAYR